MQDVKEGESGYTKCKIRIESHHLGLRLLGEGVSSDAKCRNDSCSKSTPSLKLVNREGW